MSKIGIVAGSFDPITRGHAWLIKQAAQMLGPDRDLHIVIGVNSAKKSMFTAEERAEQIRKVVEHDIPADTIGNVVIAPINNIMLIHYAQQVGARYIFRGIRNSTDFEYETSLQLINRKIDDKIETVFFVPPQELTAVSSSIVKGLVGFEQWETVAESYVHPFVLDDIKAKAGNG